MKRWAWTVAALYLLTLVVLTVPVAVLAFAPKISLGDIAKLFLCWPYWLWLGAMFAGQYALLIVPAQAASRRPVTQRSLWLTILAGGLMAGGLASGAVLSLYEFVFRDRGHGNWPGWMTLGIGVVTWCLWARVFSRMSRKESPGNLVSRQCRLLFNGSILELLIAVPTHIVARHRDYCCAGFMSFVGLTMGLSVMLFSFGPAVFLLYVERWKRLHPTLAGSRDNERLAL